MQPRHPRTHTHMRRGEVGDVLRIRSYLDGRRGDATKGVEAHEHTHTHTTYTGAERERDRDRLTVSRTHHR